MPIDTAAKRRSISGIPALIPGVTPNASKDEAWRRTAAWGYSGAVVFWSWDLEAYIGSAWVSISEDVLLRKQAVVASRGIDGSDVTNRVASPGSLTSLLDNGESNSGGKLGYYSPGHTNMRANFGRDTLVRLKFVYNGQPYYKWRGYITDLVPTPGRYKDRQSQLSATDFMQRMVEHKLQAIPVQENQRSDQLIQTVLNNMAVAPVNVTLDTDKFTLPYALHSEQDEKTTAMGATQKICQTALAYAYIRGDQTDGETFTYQREQTRAATQIAASFDDTMSGIKPNRDRERIKNRLVGSIHPPSVDALPTTLLASLDNEIPIDAGGSLIITLRFKDAASKNRVNAKDIVTSLVADTHYRMSALANSGGNDMNASLSPSVTAGGNVAIVTLVNSGAVRGFVSKLDIYGKGVFLNSPVEIVVESGNADKQLNYDFYYLTDPYRAKTFLTHLHARTMSEGADLDSFYFYPGSDPTLMDAAMKMDIGDRFYAAESVTQPGAEYIINKVIYTVQPDGDLRVDWLPEQADTHSYFVLDSSELDGTDVLSPY